MAQTTISSDGFAGYRPRAGSVPGAFDVHPDALKPTIRVIAYGPEEVVDRGNIPPSQVQDFVGKYPVVWVNVDGLGDGRTLEIMAELFSLHQLALADVVNVRQRPKVDQYGEALFVVMRMASLDDRLATEQVSLFLGEGFVLTFQERPGDCLDPVRERIQKSLGRIRSRGADYLAYAILDAVVDNHFPILEQLGERIQALEDRALARPDGRVVREIHRVKRDLLALRRAIWPQRDAVNWLAKEPMSAISNETRLYLRDCYDHLTQCIDLVETYRELASGLMEAYMTAVSNRMNEVMKVLTVIATIFIPLTFIAGVYGMNFKHMPELEWPIGYALVLVLMAAVAVGMVMFFRKRGWLSGPAPEEED